jgi:hypothetical protein
MKPSVTVSAARARCADPCPGRDQLFLEPIVDREADHAVAVFISADQLRALEDVAQNRGLVGATIALGFAHCHYHLSVHRFYRNGKPKISMNASG